MTNRLTMTAAAVLLGLMMLTGGCYKPTADGGLYNPPVEKFHSRKAMEAGDYATAEAKLNYVLQNDPQDWEARYLLGKVYLETGRPLAAQSELELALSVRDRDDSDTPKIIEALAESLYQQEKYDQLYAFLNANIDRYEGWEFYASKARFLAKANDIDGAVLAYRQAAFFSRNEDAGIYVEMADFFKDRGDYDSALQALQWAYYIDDERADLPNKFRELGYVPGPTLREAPPQPMYDGDTLKLPRLIGDDE